MDVKARQAVERQIATKIVDDALAAGYTVEVDTGGDTPDYEGTDREKILGAMFATDDEFLFLERDGKKRWVHLVYGNGGGFDVISDYTSSLDDLLTGANNLANALEANIRL